MAIIGYDTAGGSLDDDVNYIISNRFQSSVAGDANTGTFFWSGGFDTQANEVRLGVYASSGETPDGQALLSDDVGDTPGTAGQSNESGVITWTGILADTDYFLAVNMGNADGGGQTDLYYDTATPGFEDCHFKNNTHGGSIPDPFPISPSGLSREYSFWVDFTESTSDVSLTADPSQLTITGAVAGLVVTLAAAAGALALTGASADFTTTLDAQPGTLVLTGAEADLISDADVTLDAAPGADADGGSRAAGHGPGGALLSAAFHRLSRSEEV